jgi:malate dehydrogenase (oxaloacetate-decarboxylating)(NADP+)
MSDDQATHSSDPFAYHAQEPSGKLQIAPTKPVNTAEDLSLAYTPGVGKVSSAIADNQEDVWKYTNRKNTVAVISDGTAVLGLGNIGAEAGMPVMEGKAILFKRFADIDAYPLCLRLDTPVNDPDYVQKFADVVAPYEPSYGGINLEDVKAPICFELEEKLNKRMKIPIFHDDQHGTAVILMAGLINSLKVTDRNIKDLKIVVNGAGAAGMAFAKILLHYGVEKPQIYLCDSRGLVTETRNHVNEHKLAFAQPGESQDLRETIKNADFFVGVSAANIVDEDMVRSMAPDPIIFAAANPVPEIMPDKARAAGAKIVATGRSDFPNQVNNALGFPGIFRGTLDTRATAVNEAMKIAAAEALAELTNEAPTGLIKEILEKAYPHETALFNTETPLNENYIIPKQFDLRVVPRVAARVAQAAIDTKVAQIQIPDLAKYEEEIFQRVLPMWNA